MKESSLFMHNKAVPHATYSKAFMSAFGITTRNVFLMKEIKFEVFVVTVIHFEKAESSCLKKIAR